MPTIRVQAEPFDTGQEIAALTAGRTDIGGIGCFIGTVRAVQTSPALIAMTLEHYPAMTEKAMRRIAQTAEQRWRLLACTLVHRVGRLELGAPIVLVLTASAHREPALAATAFLIDWLKTRAPFWKQEHFANDTSRWVEARADDDEAAARWTRDPLTP